VPGSRWRWPESQGARPWCLPRRVAAALILILGLPGAATAGPLAADPGSAPRVAPAPASALHVPTGDAGHLGGGVDTLVGPRPKPTLWYFWREDCPVCRQADGWLESLQQRHPHLTVRRVDILRDLGGRALFHRMMEDRGERTRAVPTFILNDRVWVGFSRPLGDEMERAIRLALGEPEVDPEPPARTLDLGPLGLLELEGRPMAGATALIAFVDGFNPCSLWVLTVLLAMILGTRSRTRIGAVGVTFLLVTAGIYGAFIVGLFTVLEMLEHLTWIRVAVAALALGFGLVSVKDFLAFRRGPTLSIPERFKPGIYRGGRTLRKDRPLLLTLGITVGLAGGVALVELPCTAGFPMIWTTMLSEAGVGRGGFYGLLGLYLLIYLSVEIAILAGALVTLRATRLQEVHGRALKLVGGTLMIALAGVLLVDPTVMESLAGSMVVVGGAVAVALGALGMERVMSRRRDPPR